MNLLEKIYASVGIFFLIISLFYFLQDYMLAIPSFVKAIYVYALAYLILFSSNLLKGRGKGRGKK